VQPKQLIDTETTKLNQSPIVCNRKSISRNTTHRHSSILISASNAYGCNIERTKQEQRKQTTQD